MPHHSLDAYLFEWNPDRWTIPRPAKSDGMVETYSSVVYFSFGVKLSGKKVVLEWDWMSAAQWEELEDLYAADTELTWSLPDYSQYLVEFENLDGEYFEVVGEDLPYRRNVKATLLIKSQVRAAGSTTTTTVSTTTTTTLPPEATTTTTTAVPVDTQDAFSVDGAPTGWTARFNS